MPADVSQIGVSDLIVASNRGPVSFVREAGNLVAKRGGGGLVSSLAPLVEGTGATWIAAAMTDADRDAAGNNAIEVEGFRFRSLTVDPDDYRMAYDVVSNGTLWFLHHGLHDTPAFDREWREAWEGYHRLNRRFAEAVAEEAADGAVVLVQDYHLALLGGYLQRLRPDARAVHFSHTPFCSPAELRLLPEDVADELLEAMSAFVACGFHSSRWRDAFVACCIEYGRTPPSTFVAPLAPDASELEALAISAAGQDERRWLDDVVGDRRLLLRVDRIELSKNLIRGFTAYDALLEAHPEWRGRVVFLALVYPSREALEAYRDYRAEVEAEVDRINQRWGTPDWTPIVLDPSDNVARSAAALTRYDVLLVNPLRDGLNLVAKEGPLVNRTDGVVVLSREAGAWDELGQVAIGIDPFDVGATAEAIRRALELEGDERRERSAALRDAAAARNPRDWLDDQLKAARA